MKTDTYQNVKFLAAFLAGRADDTSGTNLKLSVSEGVMLRAFFAAELPDLWNGEAWPELCDHLEAVTLDANQCFDKREDADDEMGEILAILECADPRISTHATPLPASKWNVLDGRVNVVTCLTTVWVDWQSPVPDLMDSDLDATLDAYELPARFKLMLAARRAALLLADEDIQRASQLRGLADQERVKQASRIKRPWWRC